MLYKKCAWGTLRAQSGAPQREEGKLEQMNEGRELRVIRPEEAQG